MFYGAASTEAPALHDQPVSVVGGASSAGQAAIHLADHASEVNLAVRGTRLADSMSDYLIRVVDQTPNIRVRLHTEVIDAHGPARLEGLTLHDRQTGATELVPAAALFVLIAAPSTGRLAGAVHAAQAATCSPAAPSQPGHYPHGRLAGPRDRSKPARRASSPQATSVTDRSSASPRPPAREPPRSGSSRKNSAAAISFRPRPAAALGAIIGRLEMIFTRMTRRPGSRARTQLRRQRTHIPAPAGMQSGRCRGSSRSHSGRNPRHQIALPDGWRRSSRIATARRAG